MCTINDTYETLITRGLIKLIENCQINVLTQAMLFSIPRHKSTQIRAKICCLRAFVPTNSKLK